LESALSNTAKSDQREITSHGAGSLKELIRESASVRVAPNSYLISVFVSTFFGGLVLYLGYNIAAAVFLGFGWIAMPLAYLGDRIVFDGKQIIRTGLIPRLWSIFNRTDHFLEIDAIEQIETQAVRALKRGGTVFYRYRTTISAGDVRFVVSSGGENYRRLVKQLLPHLSENVLDNRSIELRDYINEPKETLMKAEFAKVPSSEVLEASIYDFEALRKERRVKPEFGDKEFEQADYLRTLANELRLSGNLLQALEVFRRALFLNPKDGWLLFEFARCLHSFAGAEKNSRLEKRAMAVLRLAERRAGNDVELLSRVGESYFQYGDWSRATKVFKYAISRAENSFRSIRGMAEVSLREGKIAHVIHHFTTAKRLAETPSLRRWAQAEADYFAKLNSDAEYMDMEVSRVNLLDSLETAKRTSLKAALFGLPAIVSGLLIEVETLVNIGWAVSCVGLVIWVGIVVSRNLLSERVPLDQGSAGRQS
jgi:tetratricopeptide (TPR) repeat protein